MPSRNVRAVARVDVVVIGGGIAGVSVAHELAAEVTVVLVEAEPVLAHHTTGRSAAAYLESYGGPVVRPLTLASRAALAPFMTPRPLLWIGAADRAPRLAALAKESQALVPSIHIVDADDVTRLCPALRADFALAGVLEPDAMDIDVAALHQWYVARFRERGGTIRTDCRVTSLRLSDHWTITGANESIEADLIVDAAGAWGDAVAASAGVGPIGLRPLRRTAFTATLPAEVDARAWPLVADIDDGFYFKPEGPHLLCSLADETPSPPCDAKPEEADVALAIERINAATTLELRHVRSAWAGLRTFSPDRVPVVGRDPDEPSFVWLVGQGGFGIQTAPALARVAADVVLRDREPPAALAPARLR